MSDLNQFENVSCFANCAIIIPHVMELLENNDFNLSQSVLDFKQNLYIKQLHRIL